MQAAYSNTAILDKSFFLPSLPGMTSGVAVISPKGPAVDLVTSKTDYEEKFGESTPKMGTSMFSAENYLNAGNQLYVARVIPEGSKVATALVRAKTVGIDTSDALAIFNDEASVIKPLAGMTLQEIESYSFPFYHTNREYEIVTANIFENQANTDSLRVNTFEPFEVGDKISFSSTAIETLNDSTTDAGESLAFFTIQKKTEAEVTYDKVILDGSVTVGRLKEVKYKDSDGNVQTYPNHPYIKRTAVATSEILVSNADYIHPNDILVVEDEDGVTAEVTVTSKDYYTEQGYFLDLDREITAVNTNLNILKIKQYELEQRDSFLVYSLNEGEWGNDISVGIAPNKYYDDAFNVLVYENGVLVETHEVTKDYFVNDNNIQMQIEEVINNFSKYIRVKNNVSVSSKPKNTDHSFWRKNPKDLFLDTSSELAENVLKGHTEVLLNSNADLSMGDRIKFLVDIDVFGKQILSAEYKVQALEGNNKIFLDRPLEEDEITKTFLDSDNTSHDVIVKKFNPTYSDTPNGIVDGVQYYPITRLDSVYYNYNINVAFEIAGEAGKLLDAGVNKLIGGLLGQVTVYDILNAYDRLAHSDDTPIKFLMDGGHAFPEVALKIAQTVDALEYAHGFISVPLSVSKQGAVAERNYVDSLNLNTWRVSAFSNQVFMPDQVNKRNVYVSAESFAVTSQTIVARDEYPWIPAAGWKRGVVQGLKVLNSYSKGELDLLVESNINPIRHKKGVGLSIWGNITQYKKPSPLQSRHIAILVVLMKHQLDEAMDFELFELNTKLFIKTLESALNTIFSDYKAKGAIYDFKVKVEPSDLDFDQKRVPILIGIQPTQDVEFIPISLGVFNKSLKITL